MPVWGAAETFAYKKRCLPGLWLQRGRTSQLPSIPRTTPTIETAMPSIHFNVTPSSDPQAEADLTRLASEFAAVVRGASIDTLKALGKEALQGLLQHMRQPASSAAPQANAASRAAIDSRTGGTGLGAGMQGLLALGAEMERLADAVIANGKAPAGVTRADLLKLGQVRLQQLNAQAVNEFAGYDMNAPRA